MGFVLYYIKWHYTDAFIDLIGVIRNFLFFFYNLFSIKILFKTLFSPFHRMTEVYDKRGFKLEKLAEAFIVNSLMRVVGALLRFMLIIFGLFFMLLTFVFGAFFIIAWALAPFLVALLFLIGLKFISVG